MTETDAETVHGQLRRLIAAGASPGEATDAVMSDLPPRWKDWARPFVLRRASGIEGELVNGCMRRALLPVPTAGADGQLETPPVRLEAGRRRQLAAVARLHDTVYRLPDGQRILWDDMTIDAIDLKIAQMRKLVGSLVDHLRVLEAARKLCAEHGVDRLGDVEDWAELLRAVLDAQQREGGEAA